MAPNPKVAKAFRAMKEIGIKEEIVKPVLKRLLKLYDRNWVLIEEENYRALADAIFDSDETQTTEQSKKPSDTDPQEENMEVETQVHDEPERPLKRLRLRHQVTHNSASEQEERDLPQNGSQLKESEIKALLDSTNIKGKNTVSPELSKAPETSDSPSQERLREKGKQPFSAQIIPRGKRPFPEKSSYGVKLIEPKQEPGIVLLPKKKMPNSPVLVKPKNEPISDDMVHYEVPLAILPPDPSCQVNSSFANNATEQTNDEETPASHSVDDQGKGHTSPASSNKRKKNYALVNIPEESPPLIEVASSNLGEVMISMSCNPALGRPHFHMPHLDAVLKSVEDKYVKTYKISDPNFSVMKLMRDMCESFLELGTDSIDSLQKNSGAPDGLGLNGHEENSSIPSNGSVSLEVPPPEVLKIPPSMNVVVDTGNTGNGLCESDVENKKDSVGCDKKLQSLEVSKQNEPTADEIRTLFDRNDITRGEEKVKISLINEINKDKPPSFHYIPNNLVFQNAYLNFALARIGNEDCCSTCFGDCLSSSVPCACARETGGEFAYTSDGLVKEELLEECISMNRDPEKHKHIYCKDCPLQKTTNGEMAEACKGHLVRKFIKECWSKCGCSKHCGNRLVQRGITRNLQVFMTAGKGWGIRTLEELPKGAFVCEYVGEVLTNSELYERNDQSTSSHAYPVLLDADWGAEKVLKDEEALCLDATHYGNVARFLNHRCLDANMVEIPVEVETPDHHYYHLAFFTTRKIDAMEELTWDYGIDFDDHDHPVKAFRCRCGSKFCRNMKRSNRSRRRYGRC